MGNASGMIPTSPVSLARSATSSQRPKDRQLIHRSMRKLPSGQPVVLTIVRELLPDASIRFRILMYHPVTAREIFLVLVNPLLDKVLGACGLGNSRTATVEAVDEAKKEVS